jgi:hypothetical protein
VSAFKLLNQELLALAKRAFAVQNPLKCRKGERKPLSFLMAAVGVQSLLPLDSGAL